MDREATVKLLCKNKYRFVALNEITLRTNLRPTDDVITPWGALYQDGEVTIFSGYAWDGCTPKLVVADWIVLGTPDGPPSAKNLPTMYWASAFHDWCYQYGKYLTGVGVTRKQVDAEFRSIAVDFGCPKFMAAIYYRVLRMCFWLSRRF